MTDFQNRFKIRTLNFQMQYLGMKSQHFCALAYVYTKFDMEVAQSEFSNQLESDNSGFWSSILQSGLQGFTHQSIEKYMDGEMGIAINKDGEFDDGYDSQDEVESNIDFQSRFSTRALNFKAKYAKLKLQHCYVLAYFFTKLDMKVTQSKFNNQLNSENTGFWLTVLQSGLQDFTHQSIEKYMRQAISTAINKDNEYDDCYDIS